jgi:hypothetical protein
MYTREGTIKDRREMLRVKVKSLAAEARIIRQEELRSSGMLRDELRNHRVIQLRFEARSAHLAYGFIKGRSLVQMENKASTKPNWKRIKEICKKYGPFDFVVPEPQS